MKIYKKAFLLVVLFFGLLTAGTSQNFNAAELLPVDPAVTIGQLDNGFTYYIRENGKPENRVELRLVVNAGSVLEDDDQQGLAHFVEHMAFNGTEHFEKNELKNYLESIGIRFGPELNAYTSFDETVYMLTIPSDSLELLENGFLVMEDWAHGMSLTSEEIDKERGVIVEEWRIGRGWGQRMRDKFLPVLFQGSKYEFRLPIGQKETIEEAPYEAIRRFYHDWYRPDLMALIVVGDIDKAYAEEKIKDHFSELSVPEITRPREEYDVPDHEGTLVKVVTDKEAPINRVLILHKDEYRVDKDYGDYLHSLKYTFITGMLNRRLYELTEKEDPPFIAANYGYGGFASRTLNVLQGGALVSEDGVGRGLEALLTESQRIDQHGFTQSELDRYKLEVLTRYETYYNERDKTESNDFVEEYTRSYLEDEAIPGIEFEYNFVKEHLDRISLEEINELARELISEDNRVIIVLSPEKEGVIIPEEAELLSMAGKISNSEVDPYEEAEVASALMETIPKAGSIVSEKAMESIDAVDLTLSNGIRVILKPTDFKNDEIILSAFSEGGHSQYEESEHFSAINADGIIQESGVKDFSKSDISKILAGKSVYVAPSIGTYRELMSAQAKASDLESMFQLLHLYFTEPRKDPSAFNSYITKRKDLYANLAKEPQNYFLDKYFRIKAQDHPRGDYLPTEDDWNRVDFEKAIAIYKDRFSDAGSFTFVIVGAFNTEEIKPLLKTYVASLPGNKRDEKPVDLGIRPPFEKTVRNIYKGNDPKSLAMVYFEKEVPGWNEKDAYLVEVLSQILDIKYTDVLREEMSGVYGVSTSASYSVIPYERASLQIMIPCAPENVDKLVNAAINELVRIRKEGVDDNDLQKAREQQKRTMETKLQTNDFWVSRIREALILELDLDKIGKLPYLDDINSEELKRVANTYFDSDRYLQVVLYPESMETEQ